MLAVLGPVLSIVGERDEPDVAAASGNLQGQVIVVPGDGAGGREERIVGGVKKEGGHGDVRQQGLAADAPVVVFGVLEAVEWVPKAFGSRRSCGGSESMRAVRSTPGPGAVEPFRIPIAAVGSEHSGAPLRVELGGRLQRCIRSRIGTRDQCRRTIAPNMRPVGPSAARYEKK